MDTVTADQIVQLVRTNAWIPLLAVVVGAIIRVSKNDPAVARLKFYIKPENRAAWALAWGIALAALDRLATGGTWYDALAGGLVAGSAAIAGHEIIVNKIRKGRDFGVKKAPPPPPAPPWEGDSLRPGPPKHPSSWPIVARAVPFVVLVAAACSIFTPKTVCATLDLANNLCPLFLVKLADGTTELVPRDRIIEAAMRTRLSRMHVEAEIARQQSAIDARLDVELRRLDGGTE